MSSNRLASYSQRMAAITLVFIVVMMVVNTAAWLFPDVASRYGLGFALTERQLSSMSEDAMHLAGWQRLGAILLSSIPLLAVLPLPVCVSVLVVVESFDPFTLAALSLLQLSRTRAKPRLANAVILTIENGLLLF